MCDLLIQEPKPPRYPDAHLPPKTVQCGTLVLPPNCKDGFLQPDRLASCHQSAPFAGVDRKVHAIISSAATSSMQDHFQQPCSRKQELLTADHDAHMHVLAQSQQAKEQHSLMLLRKNTLQSVEHPPS